MNGLNKTITAKHIADLYRYASKKGIEIPEANKNLFANIVVEGSGEDSQVVTAEAIVKYSELCHKTYPVTGETIEDSYQVVQYSRPLLLWSLFLMILVFANEIIGIRHSDGQIAENSIESYMVWIHLYGLDILAPVFWGALGSCVYLLKRLYDFSGDQSFDAHKFKGWKTRVVLGAILGGVIQSVFDPSYLTVSSLSSNGLAFLSGLSVKVIYGVFEQAVNFISERLDLEKTSATKKNERDLNQIVAEMMNDPNTLNNQPLHDLLVQLLKANKGKNE